MYKHKTTSTQYRQFTIESKNQGELLHKIYMNEVNKGIQYQVFLSQLATWLRKVHGVDTKTGVTKIYEYLRQKFV